MENSAGNQILAISVRYFVHFRLEEALAKENEERVKEAKALEDDLRGDLAKNKEETDKLASKVTATMEYAK